MPICLIAFGTVNASGPYFHGLPKSHKQGIPLSPILSSCISVIRPFDSWLASVLSLIMWFFSDSYTKHLMDFIEKVGNLPTHGKKWVSFDVDSLFTNVLLDYVLDLFWKKTFFISEDPDSVSWYRDEKQPKPGSCEYLHEEVWIWTFSVYSPSRHDLVSLREPFGFRCFLRLNNLARTINFEVEYEDSGKLPFIDILLPTLNGSLKSSVYRKPTHTANYLIFFLGSSVLRQEVSSLAMFLRYLGFVIVNSSIGSWTSFLKCNYSV